MLVLPVALPVNGILSGPGTVCSGDTASFMCNITGASTLRWVAFSTIEIVSLMSTEELFSLGERSPIERGSIEFSFSLLATRPQLVSQLRFVPGNDEIALGVPVTCEESPQVSFSLTTGVVANSK